MLSLVLSSSRVRQFRSLRLVKLGRSNHWLYPCSERRGKRGGGARKILRGSQCFKGKLRGDQQFLAEFMRGGNRKLTASEGKGIMRILQSLTGRSSEFYDVKCLCP